MIYKLTLFVLCSFSFMKIFGVEFKIKSLKEYARSKPKSKTHTQTVKQFIDELDGKDRRNYIQRNTDSTREALARSGRTAKFKKTLLLAQLLSVSGFFIGLSMKSLLLAPVLAVGLYFIPLWTSKLYIYSYNKLVSEELETALSLITTSYTRHNDIQKAVEENIEHIKNPVSSAFRQFLQGLKFLNADICSELEKLRDRIDNKIFVKWCDTLIQCQSDHTIKHTLIPIVTKFSDLKIQQSENETNMLLPLREAMGMIGFVVAAPFILKLINADWYQNLMYTFWGQLSMAVSAIAAFICANKAILLCEPIEYDV